MKRQLIVIITTILAGIALQSANISKPARASFPTMQELDDRYKSDWDKPEYAIARTADKEPYLGDMEKKICYYMNLVRMNPRLFAATYATGYKGANGYANNRGFDENEESLIKELAGRNRMPLLYPSRRLYNYAHCQAAAIGSSGEVSDPHNRERTGCIIEGAYAENIGFGGINALDVVMGWLNDAGNAMGRNQLGHRTNCLNPVYDSIGISVHNHSVYEKCMVMDLSGQR